MKHVLSAVIAILALLSIERACVRPYLANRTTKALMARTIMAYENRESTAGRAMASANLTRLREAERYAPRDIQTLMLQAGNYRALGQHERAAARYRAALAIEQRPEIYMNLAQTQLELMQFDEGIGSYVKAVRFDPFYVAQIPDGSTRAEVVRRALQDR